MQRSTDMVKRRDPNMRTQRDVRDEIAPYISTPRKTRLRESIADAKELTNHELRAKVVALRTREGMEPEDIASRLGIPQKRVLRYIEDAIDRHNILTQHKKARRPLSQTKIRSKALRGTVIGPPARYEDKKFQRECFKLAQNAIPLEEIADLLIADEKDVDKAIRLYVQRLNESESNDIEIARRIQVQQIDASIRALMPYSTGKNIDGSDHKLDFTAIDRLVKLMDAKAKLIGMNSPQRIDIRMRLEAIASSGEYDLKELLSIYEEVSKELPALMGS